MPPPNIAPAVLQHRSTTVGSSSGIAAPCNVTRLLSGAVAAVCMVLLKHHYSIASADQLRWILAPTARLVAWFTSARPVFEAGVGYVDFTHGIIIAPACAGINFMIMAFGLAACLAIRHTRLPAHQWVWLTYAAALSFSGTLAVNTLRIIVSMSLYAAPIYSGILTVERLHRLAGVGIYFGALWLFYRLWAHIIKCYRKPVSGRLADADNSLSNWLPYCWYLAIALGVPIANGLLRQQRQVLGEHGVTIIAAMLCFGAAEVLCRCLRTNLTRKETCIDARYHIDRGG